jgi:hypothetical protein
VEELHIRLLVRIDRDTMTDNLMVLTISCQLRNVQKGFCAVIQMDACMRMSEICERFDLGTVAKMGRERANERDLD